jgi:hypothetical protein
LNRFFDSRVGEHEPQPSVRLAENNPGLAHNLNEPFSMSPAAMGYQRQKKSACETVEISANHSQ